MALPLMQKNEEDSGHPARFRVLHAAGAAAPTRVLVAEDNDEMRALIAERLRGEGYEVIEAKDGPTLINAIVRGVTDERPPRSPDVIVTDVRMPGCSGLEVLERMRRNDWATPVILITAFADPELVEEAERLGAAVVLDKPLDLDLLAYVVFIHVDP